MPACSPGVLKPSWSSACKESPRRYPLATGHASPSYRWEPSDRNKCQELFSVILRDVCGVLVTRVASVDPTGLLMTEYYEVIRLRHAQWKEKKCVRCKLGSCSSHISNLLHFVFHATPNTRAGVVWHARIPSTIADSLLRLHL